VVGDGSVAFDPVPGILTDGVVLAITTPWPSSISAGAHTLVALTARRTAPTRPIWAEPPEVDGLVTKEFVPQQKAAEEAAKKAKAGAKPKPPKIFV